MTRPIASRRQGEPLVALGAVLGGWVALRVASWHLALALQVMPNAPVQEHVQALALPRHATDRALPSIRVEAPFAIDRTSVTRGPLMLPPMPVPGAAMAPWLATAPAAIPSGGAGTTVVTPMTATLAVPPAGTTLSPMPTTRTLPLARPRAMLMPAHQILLMAGLGYLELPEAVREAVPPAHRASLPRALPGTARWSGDGWMLLRRGASGAALAAGASSYGASQWGAVLRYDLAPSRALDPRAYVRFSAAIDAPTRDREVAAGLALRPLVHVPVQAMVEARVQHATGPARIAPAAMLVSSVPPLPLPYHGEGEVYAQAGWVGGRYATPFFDLQAVADKSIVRLSPSADLRAGAGAWSGGQKGAVRFDLGPRITLRTRIGGVSSRLALDWRMRVAGDAEPRSGPALTLSAGF